MRPNTAIAASAVLLIATAALIAACTGPTVGPVRSTSETSSEGTGQKPSVSRQTASPALTAPPTSSPLGPKATQAPISGSPPDPTSTQTPTPAPAPADGTPTAVMAQTLSSVPLTSGLPVYVQVVHVILMPGADSAAALAEPPPNGVFAFDPAHNALAARSPISITPQTQVVIGLTTVIQEARQAQIHAQLYRVPPDDAEPVKLVAVEAETDVVTLDHAGETFVLAPGDSRSFKRRAGEATILTGVTNTGRLAFIGALAYEPGGR